MLVPRPALLVPLALVAAFSVAVAQAQTTSSQTTTPTHPAERTQRREPVHREVHRRTPVVQAQKQPTREKPAHHAAASAPAAPAPAPAPAAPTAPAQPAPPPKGSVTGLPIPRFVSLRWDEVYLRAGPGTNYPIEWLYKRRGLPVQIEREFDVWRLVKMPDDAEGWVHEATLSGTRTVMITGAERTMLAAPDAKAAPVARLEVGVIARLLSCQAGSGWCRVQARDYRGWLRSDEFWGILPGEAVQ